MTDKKEATCKRIGDEMQRLGEKKRFEGRLRDDVGMLKFLEERDFADGGGRDALVLAFEANLLHRDHLAGLLVLSFVHDAISAWKRTQSVGEAKKAVITAHLRRSFPTW